MRECVDCREEVIPAAAAAHKTLCFVCYVRRSNKYKANRPIPNWSIPDLPLVEIPDPPEPKTPPPPSWNRWFKSKYRYLRRNVRKKLNFD